MIPLQFPRQLLLSIFGLVWFWFVSLTNFGVYSRKLKFFFYLLLGCFQGGSDGREIETELSNNTTASGVGITLANAVGIWGVPWRKAK